MLPRWIGIRPSDAFLKSGRPGPQDHPLLLFFSLFIYIHCSTKAAIKIFFSTRGKPRRLADKRMPISHYIQPKPMKTLLENEAEVVNKK